MLNWTERPWAWTVKHGLPLRVPGPPPPLYSIIIELTWLTRPWGILGYLALGKNHKTIAISIISSWSICKKVSQGSSKFFYLLDGNCKIYVSWGYWMTPGYGLRVKGVPRVQLYSAVFAAYDFESIQLMRGVYSMLELSGGKKELSNIQFWERYSKAGVMAT